MKNKKLIIGGVIAMVVIGLLMYFAVKKAKSTSVSTTTPNAGSSGATNDSNTLAEEVKKTAANQSTSVFGFVLPSWMDWLSGSSSVKPDSAISLTYNAANFPLKSGSKGNEVLNLQKYLNSHVTVPYALLSEDGKFGVLTKAALLRTAGLTEVSESWYKTNVLKA